VQFGNWSASGGFGDFGGWGGSSSTASSSSSSSAAGGSRPRPKQQEEEFYGLVSLGWLARVAALV
jgi:hypothetical protein